MDAVRGGSPLPKYYNVPVYSTDGEIQRWISPDDALELSTHRYPSGALKYEFRVDPVRPWREELHTVAHAKDNNNPSACYLTDKDMQANAGAVVVKVKHADDVEELANAKRLANMQIKRAKSKVYWWPREGRDRDGYYRTVTIVPAIPS